jgi:hypothetical protein
VKNRRERSSPVRPPGVEKTTRLRSRDPVASGVKCGPHGGMNSKMKSWTVSWLSLKTKVEPGLRGSRFMSGDWRRLHRVCGVSSGSSENHWVPWLVHKAKTRELKTVLQHGQTGLTGVRRRRPESSKRRTCVGIAWLALRLSRVRSLGIRPMEKTRRLPKRPLRGLYP